MQTHSQAARRRARAWQLGAVLLLAGAGAAIALPVTRLFEPSTGPARAPGPAAGTGVAPAQPTVNLTEFGAILAGVGQPIAPVRAAAPPAPVEPPPPVAAAPQATGEWAYIGNMISPRVRHAMVRIDQEQHVLGLGGKLGDTTVVTIEPTYIEVRAGDAAPRRIDLASRTSMTPNDAPKVPVNFRQPPPLPGGVGGARAGMAPGQPGHPGAMPGQPGAGMAATTFQGYGGMTPEQARLQADMAARAAAAQKAPYQPPARPPVAEKSGAELEGMAPEQREALLSDIKVAIEPSADPSFRRDSFRRLGIRPGMEPGQASELISRAGLDPNDPNVATAVKEYIHGPVDESGGDGAMNEEELKRQAEKGLK